MFLISQDPPQDVLLDTMQGLPETSQASSYASHCWICVQTSASFCSGQANYIRHSFTPLAMLFICISFPLPFQDLLMFLVPRTKLNSSIKESTLGALTSIPCLANYGFQAKSNLPQWKTATLILLRAVCGFFFLIATEQSSCNRYHMPVKPKILTVCPFTEKVCCSFD